MKRPFLILVGCFLALASARGGDAKAKKTIEYVQKLQAPSGGFRSHDPGKDKVRILPTLRATSAAVRALHYLGGDIPDKDACIRFVESCHDPASGGFRDLPDGKPDIFTTAVGLMAVTELKMPTKKYAAGAIKYLSDNAKSFEEIRIAAAGLERLKAKSPKNDHWLDEIEKLQNEDGTFGEGAGQARDTGGSIVTLLRLGGKAPPRDALLKVLNAGQRKNGGYGKDDAPAASDLESTYRVLRCFVMLKARPDRHEDMLLFVSKCRNRDGGYGIAPDQTSTIGGTYFASIIMHWLKDK